MDNKKIENVFIITNDKNEYSKVVIVYGNPQSYKELNWEKEQKEINELLKNSHEELKEKPNFVQKLDGNDKEHMNILGKRLHLYTDLNKSVVEKKPEKKSGWKKLALGAAVIALVVSGYSLGKNQSNNYNNNKITELTKDGLDEFNKFLDDESLGLTVEGKKIAYEGFEAVYNNGNVNPVLSYTNENGQTVRLGFDTTESILNFIKINQDSLSSKDVASILGNSGLTKDDIAILATNNSGDWGVSFAAMFAEGKVVGDPTEIFLNQSDKDILKTQLLDYIGTENQDAKIREFLNNHILEAGSNPNKALMIVAFEQILPAYEVTNPGKVTEQDRADYTAMAETICADMSIFVSAKEEIATHVSVYDAKAGIEVIGEKGNEILVNYDKHEITYIDELGRLRSFEMGDLMLTSEKYAARYDVLSDQNIIYGEQNQNTSGGSSSYNDIMEQVNRDKLRAEQEARDKQNAVDASDKVRNDQVQKEIDAINNEKPKETPNNNYDKEQIETGVVGDTKEEQDAIEDLKKGGDGYVEGSKEDPNQNVAPEDYKGKDQNDKSKLDPSIGDNNASSQTIIENEQLTPPEVTTQPVQETHQEPEVVLPNEAGSVVISEEVIINDEYKDAIPEATTQPVQETHQEPEVVLPNEAGSVVISEEIIINDEYKDAIFNGDYENPVIEVGRSK